MKRKLTLLATALFASPAFAATFTTGIDTATYGSLGTITFDDGGYIGPLGVGANDFQVGSGFDASSVGQIQTVTTKDPDWQTSDPAHEVLKDWSNTPTYSNANMDASVNFFKWGYTTVGGSKFNNMTIDTAGNYHIAKNDMSFKYYDVFQYNNGVDPVQTIDTTINFQPYAVSDAKGWCGSVLASSPDSLERMAGQVTFDFAFDVYFEFAPGSTPTFSSTQLVPDFVMRSYGSYVVDVTTVGGTGVNQHFIGSAVENNTNPATGEVDPAWQNDVSFLGAGVIPKGVWVLNDGTANVQIVEAGTAGATWHSNSFAGFAFLLRADGTRVLTEVGGVEYDPALGYNGDRASWTNYAAAAAVPEAETYAMMLIGLGLVGGMAVRRRQQMA
ncbi:PEP-CTERM sorting domain-containing protein [Sulfuriferula sp.]|uniref:PEP-CTERM sorting domain-containing protein n=1 Tax=Sulfuriferula sp. TaxID=2025307 RepID=UPI002731ECFB|nr:PEP-CTERM sorting domain-containing protein [Sulfuriferula sp.]MDP2025634.1 PEP-CTERM sorting domain-containing protein [Sulfuriferula sp.]